MTIWSNWPKSDKEDKCKKWNDKNGLPADRTLKSQPMTFECNHFAMTALWHVRDSFVCVIVSLSDQPSKNAQDFYFAAGEAEGDCNPFYHDMKFYVLWYSLCKVLCYIAPVWSTVWVCEILQFAKFYGCYEALRSLQNSAVTIATRLYGLYETLLLPRSFMWSLFTTPAWNSMLSFTDLVESYHRSLNTSLWVPCPANDCSAVVRLREWNRWMSPWIRQLLPSSSV